MLRKFPLLVVVALVVSFAQSAQAHTKQLMGLQTTLPVVTTHIANVQVWDRTNLPVFNGQVIGSNLNLKFLFFASDLDSNGVVDLSDFFLFADNFGRSGPVGDITGNGTVDFADFFLFADQYGYEDPWGTSKPVVNIPLRQEFFQDLETHVRQLGGDPDDPNIHSEIARLRSNAADVSEPSFGMGMSSSSILLYNILGQNVTSEPVIKLRSGMYFGILKDEYTGLELGKTKLTLLNGRFVNTELPIRDYIRQEVGRTMQLPSVHPAAKVVPLSYTFRITSTSNAFSPVQFRYVLQPGQRLIVGSLEELTGGAIAMPWFPPVTKIPVPDITVILSRYQRTDGNGNRPIDVTVNATSTDPVSSDAEVTISVEGRPDSTFTMELFPLMGDSKHQRGYFTLLPPRNALDKEVIWTISVRTQTLHGGVSVGSATFPQGPRMDYVQPPPPPNTAPSFVGVSMTVNGAPITGAISTNTVVTFTAVVAGNPEPNVVWTGIKNNVSIVTLANTASFSRTFPSGGIWTVLVSANNGIAPDAQFTITTNQVVIGP